MKPRLPFVVSFFCVVLFAGLVVASPDYSPLRDSIPFAPGAASSSIIPTPTNTHTLGASGSTWAGLRLGAGTQLTAPTDGNLLLLNAAGTDAGLLQFGGTTSSFPAWKRDGLNLVVRSADDTQNRSVVAAGFLASTSAILGPTAFASGSGHEWWFSDNINASAGTHDIKLSRAAAGILSLQSTAASSGSSLEMFERTAPAAPAANGVRIYAKEGAGAKTTLCALFQSGVEQCFATEP